MKGRRPPSSSCWKIPSFENTSYSISSSVSKLIEYENKPFLRIPEKHLAYRQIKSSFNSLLNYPNNNMKFPGNLPVSLLRENIDALFHHSITYAVLEKTDGCRYLMYFTVYKSQLVVALFDRAWQQFWLVDMIVHEKVALGTILDVEYIENLEKKEHVFYIFDVLAYKGVSLMGDENYHYLTRLEIARLILDHLIKLLPEENGIVLKLKNPQPISQLREFVKFEIPKITEKEKIPIDGYIFVPLENPYKAGQDLATFKLKDGTDNTIDCALRFPHTSEKSPKHLESYAKMEFTSKRIPVELWVETGSVPGQQEFYALTFLDVDKIAEYGYSKVLDLDQKIAQCRWSSFEKTNCWIIEKMREDKRTANHIHTVQKTERNIKENIKVEELFCPCPTCKSKDF